MQIFKFQPLNKNHQEVVRVIFEMNNDINENNNNHVNEKNNYIMGFNFIYFIVTSWHAFYLEPLL